MRKFFGQVIGVHITISGNEHFLCTVFDECQIPAPFVLDPHGVEILRLCAEYDHHFGGIQRGEYVRFISCAELVFEGDAGEENLEALLRQLVVQVVCKHGILRAATVGIGLLVADKHVKRLFFL